MSTTLNAYAIHWTIIKFDHKLTVKAANALRKKGFSVAGNYAMKHSADKCKAINALVSVIQAMQKQGRTGSAIIITDKQFSLSTVDYFGSAPAPKQSFAIHNAACTHFFPATQKQLSEVISF